MSTHIYMVSMSIPTYILTYSDITLTEELVGEENIMRAALIK